MKLKIKNPATGKIISELPIDTKESIENKLSLLRLGQKAWS